MTSDNEHWQIYCNARTPKGAVNWRAMGQAKNDLPDSKSSIHGAAFVAANADRVH
jgi:hypothetical protein